MSYVRGELQVCKELCRTIQISMLFVCPKTVRKGCVLPQHQTKAREGQRVGVVAFAWDQVVVHAVLWHSLWSSFLSFQGSRVWAIPGFVYVIFK